MARRPLRARVNWAMRWGGALACLAALLAYAVGPFFLVRVGYRKSINGISLELARGQVRLVTTGWLAAGGGGTSEPVPDGPQIRITSVNDAGGLPTWGEALRPSLVWDDGSGGPFADYEAGLPLWSVFVAGAIASGLAHRSHLRQVRAPRACPSCRYDLSGLPPGSPCPECATVPSSAVPEER
jgi:hypothetical protein